MLNVHARWADRCKQHGGHRGGTFAARKFISSFSPNATTTPALKPKKTIKFLTDFLPTVILFVFVFEILAISVANALIPRNFLHKLLVSNVNMFHASDVVKKCSHIRALRLRSVESWVRIKNIMGYVSNADRRTLVSIWSQDRKRSQAIADDRRR